MTIPNQLLIDAGAVTCRLAPGEEPTSRNMADWGCGLRKHRVQGKSRAEAANSQEEADDRHRKLFRVIRSEVHDSFRVVEFSAVMIAL